MKFTKWEMFYTDSKKNEDLVDQISIDVKNKRYILDVNLEYWMTEGYDEQENDVVGIGYVSRFVFDIILKAIKDMGFKQIS